MTDNSARNHFIALTAARMAGPLLILLGILIYNGRVGAITGDTAFWGGLASIAAGLFFLLVLVPQLIRRWRTPRDDAP